MQELPPLAWGTRVSSSFRDRTRRIARELMLPEDNGANWLMTCMAFESGETFSPSVRNAAGSGAIGLIQFMPRTAADLGTNAMALATMTAEQQLEYVWRYFKGHRGRIHSLSDMYMAILWPLAMGQPDSFVLWDQGKRPTTYRQNSGLDGNNDLVITKGEAASKLYKMLAKGMQADIALA